MTWQPPPGMPQDTFADLEAKAGTAQRLRAEAARQYAQANGMLQTLVKRMELRPDLDRVAAKMAATEREMAPVQAARSARERLITKATAEDARAQADLKRWAEKRDLLRERQAPVERLNEAEDKVVARERTAGAAAANLAALTAADANDRDALGGLDAQLSLYRDELASLELIYRQAAEPGPMTIAEMTRIVQRGGL